MQSHPYARSSGQQAGAPGGQEWQEPYAENRPDQGPWPLAARIVVAIIIAVPLIIFQVRQSTRLETMSGVSLAGDDRSSEDLTRARMTLESRELQDNYSQEPYSQGPDNCETPQKAKANPDSGHLPNGPDQRPIRGFTTVDVIVYNS